MRRYEYGYCCTNYDKMVSVLEGTTGKRPVYLESVDPAILIRVQDKLIKQGHEEIITFSFSQPEILVARATKEKSYTGATTTLESGLMKLIFIRGLGDNAQVPIP